jgi:hypothetical protein
MPTELNFIEVLQIVSGMLSLLKTTFLSPKNYFTLYQIVDSCLENFVIKYVKEGIEQINELEIEDLFEVAMFSESVIPRTYLFITIFKCKFEEEKSENSENLKIKKDYLKRILDYCLLSIKHPIKGMTAIFHYVNKLKGDILKDCELTLNLFNLMIKLYNRWEQLFKLDEQKNELERIEIFKEIWEHFLDIVLPKILIPSEIDTFDEHLIDPLKIITNLIIEINDFKVQELLIGKILKVKN